MAYKLIVDFNYGFFLDVKNSFFNKKITRFCYYIKIAKARKLQKYINANTAL